MPTLVSPGVSVSVTDDSFYIPASAGTVPLIFIATASNKLQPNGDEALGTQEYNTIRTITSLGQSIRTYGLPMFYEDSQGNAHHGDARNEYGLLALNQFLNVGRRAFVVRANVNLNDNRDDVVDLWQLRIAQSLTAPLGAAYILEQKINAYIAERNVASGAVLGQKSSQVAIVTGGGAKTGSSATGLANDATVYYANVKIHNVDYPIAVTGSAAQTYTTLISAINADLGAAGTAALTADGNIKITATTAATSYLVSVTDAILGSPLTSPLFANLFTAGSPDVDHFIAFETAKGPYKATVTEPEMLNLAVDALDEKFGIKVVGLDTLWSEATFDTLRNYFIDDSTSNPLLVYGNGYSAASTGSFIGIEGMAADWVASGTGAVITTEWTAAEARLMMIDAADDFQYTAEFMTETSLGATDADRRVVIAEAIVASTLMTRDLRSEAYEYTLILAPGMYEPTVISALAGLSVDIKEEAMVIADTPMNLDPEYVVAWADNVDETARIRGTNIAYYYPGGLTSNLDGKTVMCAASGIALRTMTVSDNNSELWFAPAGVRRGGVTGVAAVGYVSGSLGGPTTFNDVRLGEGQRDALYKDFTNVNPIVNFPTRGILVWGQKTSAAATSARDRVNVERLIMYVRRQLRKNTMPYIFEPNDQLTRDDLKATVDGFLGDILIRRGLYDYATVCDATNNTPDRIDRNELYIDVALKPVKAVEFLFIPIRIVNTGTSI